MLGLASLNVAWEQGCAGVLQLSTRMNCVCHVKEIVGNEN